MKGSRAAALQTQAAQQQAETVAALKEQLDLIEGKVNQILTFINPNKPALEEKPAEAKPKAKSPKAK